jgi:hypothetical protein
LFTDVMMPGGMTGPELAEKGDLLLTGTPAGVGPVAAGDVLEAKCALTPALHVQYLGLEAR